MAKKSLNNNNKVLYSVLIFFGLHFSYVSIDCFNGLFNSVFLPPLVLLYSTFPFALLLFTILINTKIFKQFLDQTKLENLVGIHIFRLIGVFFLLLAYYNALPNFFAIIAGLGDIITAITSIFVVKAIRENKPYAKKLTLIWNTFGFLDITFTSITAILLTKLFIDNGRMGVNILAQFPYCFIPAFAPPTIIFLHVAIFKKIKKTFT